MKALRKAGVSNQEEANQVLLDFLPKYNQRFTVAPAQTGTAYVPWPSEYQVDDFFCFKYTRTVTNDNTIPFNGQRLQIPPGPRQRSYAQTKVDLRQHLDGRLEVHYQGYCLATFHPVKDIPLRVNKFVPAPGQVAPKRQTQIDKTDHKQTTKMPCKPAPDHPWRRYGQTLKGRRLG